ncbi:4'-phosphopantetheinyl transferase family protein [Eubacterium ruminantium]|uniref:4'-phosphopantetheinyl transferase family protein n=1 Tax=Eubacterium ruminantium TaxID=42322 RepID=UPI00156A279A|nr:4'-phosphopantetheinyl transferase superfamily protein [Eubacterium ruminantium]
MEIYIYKIEFDHIKENEERLLQELSEWRRGKAKRLKEGGNARITSIAAGLLIDKILKEKLGSDYAEDDIIFNSFGKPGHKDIFFNISHSGDYIVMAVGAANIGIDIEYKDDKDFKITGRFFTKEEIEIVKSQEDFRRIWTKKESLIKYLGTGMHIPISAFSVEPDVKVMVEEYKDYFNGKIYFRNFDIKDGDRDYCISLCTGNDSVLEGVILKKIGCLR